MRAPIRKLVAGVATLRSDDPVLAAALPLSARLGAELDLVHVQGPGNSTGASAPLGFRGVLRRLVDAAQPGSTASGRVMCRVRTGSAAYALLEAAGPDCDLLVLGATRRDALAGAVLGTTAGRVLRAARVPVLVLHGPLPDRPLRVLLTTDLSRHSACAHSRGAALARALAAPAGAQLRTLFVEPAPLTDEAPAHPLAQAGPREELVSFLSAEVPLAGSVPIVRSGAAAAQIEREAREWGADLIVLGTHGRRGARRLLLGSVAETVIRQAPCATLVVPPVRLYSLERDRYSATRSSAPARMQAAGRG